MNTVEHGLELNPKNSHCSSASIAGSALLIAVVCLVITGWNLHLQAIANPDEPRYAQPARSMLRGGDWIVPVYNTKERLVKPIFFYWLIAATGIAGETVGTSLATGMRCGPVLMALLAVLAVFVLGSRLRGARCGLLAAFILMTAHYFHECARELVVDMTLTAFVAWAWCFLWLALERINMQRGAVLPLLGFYVCIGLTSLTKGPILAVVLIALPLLGYLWWNGSLSTVRKLGLVWGAPLALVLGCWWFVAVQCSGHDMRSVWFSQGIGRALGKNDHQQAVPFLFYVYRLGLFAPWVLALPPVVWWTIRSWRASRRERGGVAQPPPAERTGEGACATALSSQAKFLACALAVPFILLGLSFSKRALYILPLYPFLALWVAWSWERAVAACEGRPARRLGWLVAGISILVCAAGAILLPRLRDHGAQLSEIVAASLTLAALAGGGLFAARALLAGRHWRATIAALFAACAICIGYESVLRPIRERELDSERFYAQVAEQLHGRPVVVLAESSNEAVWYLDRPNELIDNPRFPALKAQFFDAPEGTMLLAPRDKLDSLRDPRMAKLKEALCIAAEIPRGKQMYVLALPRPDRAPDPSIFVARQQADTSDDD